MSIARRDILGGALAAACSSTLLGATPATPGDSRKSSTMNRCCTTVELRQYTLRGGRRDELISLFERAFIEPQEAVGAHVIGQFRDLDDPDRFVWLRGFDDMAARQRALTTFYGGPAWKADRLAANATMLDSDNVLLLRPSRDQDGFEAAVREEAAERAVRRGVIAARIHYLDAPLVDAFAAFFETQMRPRIQADGARLLARFVTETSANNFPALPIRDREHVFVWFARFDDEAAERAFAERASASSGWRDTATDTLLPAFMRKPEVLRLAPAEHSALR